VEVVEQEAEATAAVPEVHEGAGVEAAAMAVA